MRVFDKIPSKNSCNNGKGKPIARWETRPRASLEGGNRAAEPEGDNAFSVHRPNWLTVAGIVLAGVVAAVVIAVVLGRASSAETFACSGVQIDPGDDLDAIVNGDPGTRATTFCVHASLSGTTYPINNMIVLKAGDRLLGEPGEVITRGPASYGAPLVRIRGDASVDKLIGLRGRCRQGHRRVRGRLQLRPRQPRKRPVVRRRMRRRGLGEAQ